MRNSLKTLAVAGAMGLAACGESATGPKQDEVLADDWRQEDVVAISSRSCLADDYNLDLDLYGAPSYTDVERIAKKNGVSEASVKADFLVAATAAFDADMDAVFAKYTLADANPPTQAVVDEVIGLVDALPAKLEQQTGITLAPVDLYLAAESVAGCAARDGGASAGLRAQAAPVPFIK